jgi:hypothetical protein
VVRGGRPYVLHAYGHLCYASDRRPTVEGRVCCYRVGVGPLLEVGAPATLNWGGPSRCAIWSKLGKVCCTKQTPKNLDRDTDGRYDILGGMRERSIPTIGLGAN